MQYSSEKEVDNQQNQVQQSFHQPSFYDEINVKLNKNEELPSNDAHNFPWRRLFARFIDFGIYRLVWLVIEKLFLHWNYDASLYNLLTNYVVLGIMLVLEPILLCVFGTTLGKLIFGFRLRDLGGNKLSFHYAFGRTVSMIWHGLGWEIPIYEFYRYYRCYKECNEAYQMVWDENLDYTLKDKKGVRLIAIPIVAAGMLFLSTVIVNQAFLPVNRGSLTQEEFVENVNEYIKFLGVEHQKLNLDGTWNQDENDYIIMVGSTKTPEYEFIMDGEQVIGVRMELYTTDDVVYRSAMEEFLAYLSLWGAQKKIHWNHVRDGLKFVERLDQYSSYSIEYSGVRISNEVSITGYEVSDQLLFSKENEEPSFHMMFTIELVNP